MRIQQRPARISRIDGRIGLDGFVDVNSIGFLHRANRAYDSAGQGPRKTEGVSNGVYLLPNLQISGIAHDHGVQVRSFDLDDRQVMRAVASHHRGTVLLAVVKRDLDLSSLGDDVVVRQDVPFPINNETRTLSFLGHESVEEI